MMKLKLLSQKNFKQNYHYRLSQTFCDKKGALEHTRQFWKHLGKTKRMYYLSQRKGLKFQWSLCNKILPIDFPYLNESRLTN